jgi:hypothetical protein
MQKISWPFGADSRPAVSINFRALYLDESCRNAHSKK